MSEAAKIFPLLAIVSLLSGWLIPAFYEWTGADQSKSPPIVLQTFWALLIGFIVACILLWRLRTIPEPHERDFRLRFRFRFQIWSVMIVTTWIAMGLVLIPNFVLYFVGVGVQLFALWIAIGVWIDFPKLRWRLISLVSCMYFPFAWIVKPVVFSNLQIGILWMASGLPAIIPTLLIGSIVQRHAEQLQWLASGLAGCELLVGIAIISRAKLSIAYQLGALFLSLVGSFVLNALVRM